MTGKPKVPILPKVLMSPERAARTLRTLSASQFNKVMCYEIAAVIEQLAEKAAKATEMPGNQLTDKDPVGIS